MRDWQGSCGVHLQSINVCRLVLALLVILVKVATRCFNIVDHRSGGDVDFQARAVHGDRERNGITSSRKY